MQEFKSLKADGSIDPEGVSAVITNRGIIVTQEMLKSYEIGKAMSKQTEGFKEFQNEIIEPPFNKEKLMSWLHASVVHNSCVQVKKNDAVSLGFDLINDEDANVEKDKTKNQTYKDLLKFFKKCNEEEDIISVLKKVFIDWEGNGDGFIEVSRNVKNVINGLMHCNSVNIRANKDKKRFVQQVGVKYVWFKKFGIKEILNKNTGKWEKELPPELQANELIQIKTYSWMSTFYGVPEWLCALYAMYGNMKEMEYNIDFFVNFGIPAYAILIQGAQLTQEVKEGIEKFFEVELKGSVHKTITLNTPKGAEVEFVRLNVETKEASFRMYRADNRDEILTAHHVPPYRIGLIIQGQLGGNVAEESDRIYLDSVINPRQTQLCWMINELIIKEGLLATGWTFVFNDIDFADKVKKASLHVQYFNIGAMTQNEIRQDIGLDPFKGGDIFYAGSGLVPIGVSQDGIDSGRTKELPEAPAEPETPQGAEGTPPTEPKVPLTPSEQVVT
jgi:PBSX family phage portal protein